jgi:hypothetical protein
MEILNPSVVLFFTGPKYNASLYSQFPGLELLEMDGHDPSKTSMVRHPALPTRAWRTYHPQHLHYGHWHILDDVLEAVRRTRA